MSYNEIAETFSEYSKVKSKNCQHLIELFEQAMIQMQDCLLYTSPSPRDRTRSRMPSSA